MPTKQHFHAEFASNFGMYYRVEIWHKTTEVTASTEITLGGGGFELKYKKLQKPLFGGVMPSTCVVKFLVNDSTELTAAHGILSENNQSFYIRIKRSTDAAQNWNLASLWWGGWVESGFDGYPDKPFPYNVDIKATDSLNRQLNKYNNQTDVASQSDFQNLSYPLQLIEDKFELDTIPAAGAAFFQWAFQSEWWSSQTSSSGIPADTNPLRKTYYNRAAFVTDPEDWPLTIQDPNKELKGVLEAFNLRVLLSSGKYWVQQPNFLDVADPEPSVSTSADASGGEVFPSSGILGDMAKQITIDNATNTPETSYGGVIKAGGKYTQRNDAHSVRCKYIFGSLFCPINPANDYTAGLVSLGFLAQGSAANLSLFLNIKMEQEYPLTGGSAVTPIGGITSSVQGQYMTGLLACRLKVGNKYLRQQNNALSIYQLEWSTNAASVFTLLTGAGSAYDNLDGITADQSSVQNNLAQFGGGYPWPFTEWKVDEPTVGKATAVFRFYMAGVPLPDLGSTYGEVQFEIVDSASYALFWTENVPWTNIWQNFYIDPSDDPDNEGWLNNANPAASTNLDFDLASSTPATPTATTFTNGLAPYLSDLQVEEELDTSEDAAPAGAQYMTSQTGNELAPDIDLGNLTLGTNSSANQITTIRAYDGSDYVSPEGFRSGSTGSFVNLGQLLTSEYFKTHSQPQIEISGTIISRDYEAHRTILYTDQIGATATRWIFCGGKFKPEKDEWNGSWHKLDIDGAAYTETETDIYDPTEPPVGGGGGGGGQGDAPFGGKAAPPLAANTENLTNKLGFVLNDLIVGILDEDLAEGVTNNKVDVLPLKCNLHARQILVIADKQLRAGTRIEVDGNHAAGATQLNFVDIVPQFDYTKGAVVMLRPYDLSNVIGGAAGSDYEVQFSKSGFFGAEAGFEYNWNTNFLTADYIDGQHMGTNSGHRTLWSSGSSELAYYINPSDFNLHSDRTVIMYTRDGGGSVIPSAYDSRADDVFALFHLPEGYKITTVEVKSNVNISFELNYSTEATDSVTAIETGGTTNTPLSVSPIHTIDARNYYIIKVVVTATTDEIWGAKLTLEKV